MCVKGGYKAGDRGGSSTPPSTNTWGSILLLLPPACHLKPNLLSSALVHAWFILRQSVHFAQSKKAMQGSSPPPCANTLGSTRCQVPLQPNLLLGTGAQSVWMNVSVFMLLNLCHFSICVFACTGVGRGAWIISCVWGQLSSAVHCPPVISARRHNVSRKSYLCLVSCHREAGTPTTTCFITPAPPLKVKQGSPSRPPGSIACRMCVPLCCFDPFRLFSHHILCPVGLMKE